MTQLLTQNQLKRIRQLMEDGIDAVNLQKDGAQRLIEQGGEFQFGLKKLALRLSTTKQYADEEVGSSYGYSDYKPNSKSIVKQTNRICKLFPWLGGANEKLAEQVLPENAEGWFAIPRWEKVAPTYGEAVQKVLDLIKQTRNGKFCNCREGELGPTQLRQSAKSVSIFQKLGDEQKDQDILVVPAQFGLRHRCRSVRRARKVMKENEYGLGTFAIGIMLLTHPERLKHSNDLWIDCAGDEFALVADGRFLKAPYFSFGGGGVLFDVSNVDGAVGDRSGSASVYLLQG